MSSVAIVQDLREALKAVTPMRCCTCGGERACNVDGRGERAYNLAVASHDGTCAFLVAHTVLSARLLAAIQAVEASPRSV